MKFSLLRPLLLAFVLFAASCSSDPVLLSDDPTTSAPGGSEESSITASPPVQDAVLEFEISSAEHVEGPVDYPQSPPVGGDHDRGWQNCGFYDIEVPNEQAVHSLEHGAVWVTYTDAAPAEELEQLRSRAADESHLLVTKYDDQESAFVLSAWGRQVAIPSITDPAFEDFLATFMGVGPTTPEPGAVCSSAYGIPPNDPSTIAG